MYEANSVQTAYSDSPSFQVYLQELYDRYLPLQEGQIATYIPELARADPGWFAICAMTVDGRLFHVGDWQQRFTLQSISKPFVYGLALEEHGRDAVLAKVGVEPTGDAFNAIIRLDEISKRPFNPMINAGAIATAALVRGKDATERLNRLLDLFRFYTNREIYVDMPVFLSERASGHRNRAIAHLMLNFGLIEPPIEEVLDLYFQQCSIAVTCEDLAAMAATLANGGVHPVSGERALASEYVRDVLSVMHTSGMYDFSGEWAYRVGLPAKSGVSGGIIAVVPGVLGLGIFSPPLQSQGNSLRGIRVCRDFSDRFGLHVFDHDSDKRRELTNLLG